MKIGTRNLEEEEEDLIEEDDDDDDDDVVCAAAELVRLVRNCQTTLPPVRTVRYVVPNKIPFDAPKSSVPCASLDFAKERPD